MTKLHRRKLLTTTAACLAVAYLLGGNPARADDKVIRVGTLKLLIGMTPFLYEKVAQPGYRFEITMFDSPADVSAAVATKSVDVGMVGYPVAVLGFMGGQPITVVGASTDGGFGIVTSAKSDIQNIQDLKDKRVAVQPASTVETLFRLRLTETGLKLTDVKTVRLMFQDMPAALARGDVDAFVGIEPGPSISIIRGEGRMIDKPYHTPAGGLNLVLVANPDVIAKDPEALTAFIRTHRKAVELVQKTPSEYIDVAVAKLGLPRPVAEMAMKNVFVQWRIDETWMKQAVFFNQAMIDVKQIREQPDMAKFVDTRFADAVAKER
ncbi:MAG TPA: ABC transporter substrate-binding protein [Afipia sp.]